MASESASPDGYMDMDDDSGLPPRPSPPNNVSAQDEETGGTGGSTNVVDSADAQETGDIASVGVNSTVAAPLVVRPVPQDGMPASTIRAFEDDDPPIPLWQIADREKESEGPQLHGGPPGPPCLPSEFDDSLAKRVENESEESLSDDLAHDNASTVHSTMGASVANAAAVGPSVIEGGGGKYVFSRNSATHEFTRIRSSNRRSETQSAVSGAFYIHCRGVQGRGR